MSQAVNKDDLLVEIHTEELPPKALRRLAESLLQEVQARLEKLELSYASAQFFATPRRLAVLVKQLVAQQAELTVERKGPALTAAYDQNGQPTPACVGFARSCGMAPEQLTVLKTPQGEWVVAQQTTAGQSIYTLLPALIQQALAALPIPKRMRWGNHTVEFVRPVHSVILLYGTQVIDAEILGCRTGRVTRGHRFHSQGWIEITKPEHYAQILMQEKVMADFAERRAYIATAARKQVTHCVKIDEDLLDEVTGLVEWPVAICGKFDETFLTVPQEALISAMQDHQRYFPVTNESGTLLPFFITISNIESRDPQRVIAGNERVLRARLADAAFFFTTDQKQKLSERVEGLKNIIFQTKLGTLYDKTQRIAKLAAHIATLLHHSPDQAHRAGLLAKADLTTAMVGEFPELQGLMGYYYAQHDQEDLEIAQALHEQYLPRFSGDQLPQTLTGCALALADRLDTLVGIFGIQQAPTGDKDPFGLRRAALGVLRIIIEKQLNLDLRELLNFAAQQYREKMIPATVVTEVLTFIFERLKPWYQDQGISVDVFAAVMALNISRPYDIHRRIHAVQTFKSLPEAQSLSIANKRVSNILAKSTVDDLSHTIDEQLFEHHAEQVLVTSLREKGNAVKISSEHGDYAAVLTQLADLREPVDEFFAHVMVMAEDKLRRENRLLMLKQLRELFLNVADIALLQ